MHKNAPLRRRCPLPPVALALLLAGCSSASFGGPDPAPDEAVVSDEQALTASWDVPACDEASLSSPASECDGPWQYVQIATQHGPNAYCGPFQCIPMATCAAWQNGNVLDTSSATTGTVTQTCTEKCKKLSNGEPSDTCTTNCTAGPPSGWCSAASAAARVASVRARISPQ